MNQLVVVISAIIGACKSDEDDATSSDTNTCTGTSSGSGPTFGSVTLEEATYLSSCFAKIPSKPFCTYLDANLSPISRIL